MKTKPRDLLAITEEDLKANPLTLVEQKALIALLKTAVQYAQTTNVLLHAQVEELKRLSQFEFDHIDLDYAKGC